MADQYLTERQREAHKRNDRICALYKDGTSISDIAKDVGVSRSRVYAVLEKGGLRKRVRNGKRERAEFDLDKAAQQFRSGTMTIVEIAEFHGVTRDIVASRFKRHGISRKRVDMPGHNVDEYQVLHLYQVDKLSVEKIADKLNCSTTPVFRILHAHKAMRPYGTNGYSDLGGTSEVDGDGRTHATPE